MTDTIITKTVFFSASRETVWAFLTEKDKLALWFHPAETDLADNEDFAMTGTTEDGSTTKICWGTVLEMDRPSRLVYTFTIKPLNSVFTTVIWTLEEVHGGTKLTVEHKGISAAAGDAALGILMALDAGWDRHLGELRTIAE